MVAVIFVPSGCGLCVLDSVLTVAGLCDQREGQRAESHGQTVLPETGRGHGNQGGAQTGN